MAAGAYIDEAVRMIDMMKTPELDALFITKLKADAAAELRAVCR